MLDIKGGGSTKADNYEGYKLTHDMEPVYSGSSEHYIYYTKELLLDDEIFFDGMVPEGASLLKQE